MSGRLGDGEFWNVELGFRIAECRKKKIKSIGEGKWVRGRCGSGKRWNWVNGGHGTAKKERPIATPNIDRLNKNDIYDDIYQL